MKMHMGFGKKLNHKRQTSSVCVPTVGKKEDNIGWHKSRLIGLSRLCTCIPIRFGDTAV